MTPANCTTVLKLSVLYGKPQDPAFFAAWFDNAEYLAAVTGLPAWQKVVADVPNFATGGVTILLSQV
jgi:hypothetical protein